MMEKLTSTLVTSLTSDRRSPHNFNVSKVVSGVEPNQMITTPNGGAGPKYQTHGSPEAFCRAAKAEALAGPPHSRI